MSDQKCGVCHEQLSKYKCPICELRYCSITCYKSHKPSHSEQEATIIQQQQARRDRPGTTQRVPKVDFSGFENDPEFKRLLQRYPLLKQELGIVYGLTLEPGPEDRYNWSKQPLLGPLFADQLPRQRYVGRGRGAMRGARSGMRGGRGGHEAWLEEREHGQWTQDKGNKEAQLAIKKMRSGDEDDERAEGMREFVELCLIRFRSGQEATKQANDVVE